VIEQIADPDPYVMYEMSGLAALHSASLNSSERFEYVLVAAHHHNQGLGLLQANINNNTCGNSDESFLRATLNTIYPFAIFRGTHMDGSPGCHSRAYHLRSFAFNARCSPEPTVGERCVVPCRVHPGDATSFHRLCEGKSRHVAYKVQHKFTHFQDGM